MNSNNALTVRTQNQVIIGKFFERMSQEIESKLKTLDQLMESTIREASLTNTRSETSLKPIDLTISNNQADTLDQNLTATSIKDNNLPNEEKINIKQQAQETNQPTINDFKPSQVTDNIKIDECHDVKPDIKMPISIKRKGYVRSQFF